MNLRSQTFIVARAAAATVFLLTWAYGVTALSPFAFDMFVKPRLFVWLETFVNWHHLWFLGAVVASAATLAPLLARPRAALPFHLRAAWWASAAYVTTFGIAAAWLLTASRLPLLAAGTRDLLVVPGALVPLLWLALIDHLTAWPVVSGETDSTTTSQRRVLAASAATAALLWLANLLRLFATGEAGEGAVWALSAVWALVIVEAAFVGLALLLMAAAAAADMSRRPRASEYALAVIVLAIGITEFFRRIVFPPLLFSAGNAALTAIPVGIAGAVMFAGLRVRTASRPGPGETGLDLLIAFRGGPITRILLLATVFLLAGAALRVVGPIDWAMILRDLVVLLCAALVFGLTLSATRSLQSPTWSLAWLASPATVVLIALHALPLAGHALANATGKGDADPQLLIDRFRFTDGLSSLAAGLFVERRNTDPHFYRELIDVESRITKLDPKLPGAAFAALDREPPPRLPHVFLFVIDSLRRDYLSPYNEAVSFTPSIDRWARDQFVFRNAFTRYGGTWLSIPSIWTGSALTRQWAFIFAESNALERLVVHAGYDFVVNDYTVANMFRPDTARTFLDPDVPSADTDLCQSLNSLQAHIDTRSASSPVFAYLAPMNVHIINTRKGSDEEAGGYPGFFAPYATRLKRMDSCFGTFVDYLKTRGLYDDSVIILTADHGDSLGHEGRWGHQFYVFPEDMRVPLIVQVPADRRTRFTADLGQLSFLTDITPSVYALLGYPVRDPGPEFGKPLFVAPTDEPASRRRQPFVVMSSYGSSYGLLRRNGRTLYLVDLVDRKEDAFLLFREPLGERTLASDALRRLAQREMLQGLERMVRLFEE